MIRILTEKNTNYINMPEFQTKRSTKNKNEREQRINIKRYR